MFSYMKKILCCAIVLMVLSGQNCLSAQGRANVQVREVDAAAFSLPDSPNLKEAAAVYIFDIGKSEFEGNNKGWFTLKYKRHVRAKILNNNGFDVAEFKIPIYNDGSDAEELQQLKAFTYNLEDGKVTKTELQAEQVFVDKQNSDKWLKKFAMPAVKAGSIIDVQYTIASDFFTNLQPWNFQGKYPRLWSEYEVLLPEFFKYVFLTQGAGKFLIDKSSESFKSYSLTYQRGTSGASYVTVNSRVVEHRWVMKDVPEFKNELFTATSKNYIAQITFQLKSFQFSRDKPLESMSTWPIVVDKLEKSSFFSADLYKPLDWLDHDLKLIAGNTADKLDKAKKIFTYIQDNFTCTDHTGLYLSRRNLRDVLKSKKGNITDINMLLIAMLQHEKIDAYPLILSTKENGFTNEEYPLISRFNTTLAYAQIGPKNYYLDASDPLLGFGKINANCYNGHARVIMGESYPIYMQADSLKERKVTTFFGSTNENVKWEGKIESTLGYNESLQMRKRLMENGTAEVIKTIQSEFGDATVRNVEVVHAEQKEEQIVVKYYCDLKKEDDDAELLYINPMMGKGYKENPFKSAERLYPVEMPYTTEEIYAATFEVPEGYAIDEIPKSTRINLNETDGTFEYIVAVQDDKVMLRSKLVIKKADFPPEDYTTLRDFFGDVVKKHSEQIVFKKKH